MLSLLLLLQNPETLVAQLGHEDYIVRETATATLLELGRDALQALRSAPQGDPELRLRAEILIRNITELRWTADAGDGDRPILAFATYGGMGSWGDAAGKRMVEEVFRDEPLIDYLNRHYRLVWFDMYEAGDSQPAADEQHVREGEGLAVTYLADADGRIVHTLAGYRSAAELLREAKAALDKPATEQLLKNVLQVRRLKRR